MFARVSGEVVNTAHIPLIARQTPQLSNMSFEAAEDILQYQLVEINAQSKAEPLKGATFQNLAGIAAFAAKQGERVTVYMSGCFNVDAIVIDNASAYKAKITGDYEVKQKGAIEMTIAAKGNGQELHFEALNIDQVQPV